VIIRRWQEFSGGAATLDGESQTFDGITQERRMEQGHGPLAHVFPRP
jgi:hypothetical protein